MDSKKYLIWLYSVPGLGLYRTRKLLEYFGDAEQVWKADADQLLNVNSIGPKTVEQILKYRDKRKFNQYMMALERLGVNVLTKDSKSYPENLKNITDSPELLYVRGAFGENDDKAIAIVGSRNATYYGIKMAKRFSYELAKMGITIVSGMARGIDTFAHQGALDAGGRTIAVLGSGIDVVYPPENEKLYNNIIRNGVVMSEFALGMVPKSGNFPVRNRLISGLSLGVLVIEASSRSGTLITVDYALEQGREVFAIPGNINSGLSEGTNKMIQEGAKLVYTVEDILEEIHINFVSKQDNDKKFEELSGKEQKAIYNCIKNQPMHINEIIKITGLPVKIVSSTLINMELNGIIIQLPGKFFKAN
ncbi:MAG: DNA-processing protein DprA [Clostridia bacterium]|nr:DNA-processing protein DprA [Clostridia bacterium]